MTEGPLSAPAPAAADAPREEGGVLYPFPPLSFGDVLDVAPGVRLYAQSVTFPPGFQNAYLLEDETEDGRAALTLVDPGLRAMERAWRERFAGPLADRPLRRVIATHHHPDHIGAAGGLQRDPGAELWTTRTAWLFARMMQLDAWEIPPEESQLFFRRAGYDDAQMARYVKRARINFSITVGSMPLGFRRIAADDVIEIGGRAWRVLTGHGHAPEHALLFCEADGLLLAGDQILPRISPNIGVYATEPDADPLGDWLESCARLAETAPEDALVLPGHGDPFRGAPERLRRMIDKHRRALDRLEAHLATPKRAVECFSAIYRRPIEPAVEGLATVETIAHLNHLLATGRAARALGPDDAWRYARVG